MVYEILKGDREAMHAKVAEMLLQSVKGVLKKKELVVIGVPGGRSVQGIYEAMLTLPFPWDKMLFFLVDERWVPVEDEESNFRVLHDHLLAPLNDEMVEVAAMPFNIEEGVEAYTEAFQEFGGSFDIILLGVGEDGHVASLFPDHDVI